MNKNNDPQQFGSILCPSWEEKIEEWLGEDVPSFDYAGFIVGEKQESATMLQKASGVLAGSPFVTKIFERVNCKVEWKKNEGEFTTVQKGERIPVAKVTGKAKDILLGERTALNLIARASGNENKFSKRNEKHKLTIIWNLKIKKKRNCYKGKLFEENRRRGGIQGKNSRNQKDNSWFQNSGEVCNDCWRL